MIVKIWYDRIMLAIINVSKYLWIMFRELTDVTSVLISEISLSNNLVIRLKTFQNFSIRRKM